MQTGNAGCNGVFEADQGAIAELLQQLFTPVMLAKTSTCDQPLKARIGPASGDFGPVGRGEGARPTKSGGIHLGQLTKAELGVDHVDRALQGASFQGAQDNLGHPLCKGHRDPATRARPGNQGNASPSLERFDESPRDHGITGSHDGGWSQQRVRHAASLHVYLGPRLAAHISQPTQAPQAGGRFIAILTEQQRPVHRHGAEMYEMAHRVRSRPRDEVCRTTQVHLHHGPGSGRGVDYPRRVNHRVDRQIERSQVARPPQIEAHLGILGRTPEHRPDHFVATRS